MLATSRISADSCLELWLPLQADASTWQSSVDSDEFSTATTLEDSVPCPVRYRRG